MKTEKVKLQCVYVFFCNSSFLKEWRSKWTNICLTKRIGNKISFCDVDPLLKKPKRLVKLEGRRVAFSISGRFEQGDVIRCHVALSCKEVLL